MGCPICLNPEATESLHNTLRPARQISCSSCGNFGIFREVAEVVPALVAHKDRWRASAWIREYAPPLVGFEDIEQAIKMPVPVLSQRANRMLRWIHDVFPLGEKFTFDESGIFQLTEHGRNSGAFSTPTAPLSHLPLMSVGWNSTWSEMAFMLDEVLCKEMSLLTVQNSRFYEVSPKGLIHLEGRKNENSTIGFCAMWFSDEVKPLWTDVIEPAIRSTGYEPLRIDSKQHNGKIDDEIVASIRSSRFLVADFTDHRGGVYYEAGLAHGLGLPVIFMCRNDHLDKLHFDIRQYNCIVWTVNALEDAQTSLKNRILATLGQGPLDV